MPHATGTIDARLDGWLRSFLAEMLGSAAVEPGSGTPRGEFERLAAEPEALTERWRARTSGLAAGLTAEQRHRLQGSRDGLRAALEQTAAELDWDNLNDVLDRHARIETRLDYPDAAAGDFCYVKINHGFWEQLYALLVPHDPQRMRIAADEAEAYRGPYLESLLVEALGTALQRGARAPAGEVAIEGVELGLSLLNGSKDEGARRGSQKPWNGRPSWYQQLQLGAATGSVGFIRSVFGERRLRLADGCFPRLGLAQGGLARTLRACAGRADALIHVVPPHLSGLRLLDVDAPQQCLLIPALQVHESWLGALHDLCAALLRRLDAGERLLVTTQSAVFAALFGLVLVQARRELVPEQGRLWFFDLGQVLDLANPSAGGYWVRTDGVPKHEPLFALAREAA